jgi:hypothetical protein
MSHSDFKTVNKTLRDVCSVYRFHSFAFKMLNPMSSSKVKVIKTNILIWKECEHVRFWGDAVSTQYKPVQVEGYPEWFYPFLNLD